MVSGERTDTPPSKTGSPPKHGDGPAGAVPGGADADGAAVYPVEGGGEKAHPPTDTSTAPTAAIDSPTTGFFFFCVTVAAFGTNAMFGYTIGSINSPAAFIKDWMRESHFKKFNHVLSEKEMNFVFPAAVALFPIGAMIGALTSGIWADLFGRRRTLHLNNILAITGAFLLTIAYYVDTYLVFHVGRFIVGLAAGIGSSVLPLFLVEISPARIRGAMGSLPQLVVTVTILLSQVAGLPELLGNREHWPIIFSLTIIPSVLQVICLFFVPESPKYTLIIKEDKEQAVADLAKYRNLDPSDEIIQQEIALFEKEQQEHANEAKVTVLGLFSSVYLWPLTIACTLQIGQQLSGINAAMFYSTDIFKQVVTGNLPAYMTLGMGCVNVGMTVVSIYLVDHPKFGRRLLMLIGNIGTLVCTVMLTVSIHVNRMGGSEGLTSAGAYGTCALIMLFVIFFATGPGSIPFFYVSEVFASNARASASALAVATNWSMTILVGLLFPMLQDSMGEFVFLIFAFCLLLTVVFIFFFVPDSKDKSVDEVNEEINTMRHSHCCC